MKRSYAIALSALFLLFLAGFGVLHLALPDRSFSQQENRYLSALPSFRWEQVADGGYQTGVEDYLADQFPGRDLWVQLKAWGERLSGKAENNGVYFGADGATLFAQFQAKSGEELARRVSYVEALGENTGLPVTFALIPDKSYVLGDLLPEGAPLRDDGSTLEEVGSLVSGPVQWLDLRGAVTGADAFYRTDHHWTSFGAYEGYLALRKALGVPATDWPLTPQQVSGDFYGTTWSAAGAAWIGPDEIYTLVPEGGVTGTVTVTNYPQGRPVEGSLYVPAKLEGKDQYAFFLGGNQPLSVLHNSEAAGGKLLVIRDSYADALAPFLALDFQEVHLLDLRYYRLSLRDYVEEEGFDQILVLYSASNFLTDGNLFLLGG